LDYGEDSTAETDGNFVLTEKGGVIEIQATAEKVPFTPDQFQSLWTLAQQGVQQITEHQKKALGL
jgi:ribonuclease PH